MPISEFYPSRIILHYATASYKHISLHNTVTRKEQYAQYVHCTRTLYIVQCTVSVTHEPNCFRHFRLIFSMSKVVNLFCPSKFCITYTPHSYQYRVTSFHKYIVLQFFCFTELKNDKFQ